MRKQVKLFIFAVVFISILAFLPTNVSADDDDDKYYGYLDINIVDAYYCDYDDDGYENDIVVNFKVDIKSSEWDGVIKYYTWLELPSGITYSYIFYQKCEDKTTITMIWHNYATEGGWYTFSVYADARGEDAPRSGYDSLVFDPPVGEPDLPWIEII
ncbi:MAG: hypothetical protein RTU92_11450 [Candidatus Thorarchaeota archaeon]